jgi:hypothetical protein
MPVRVERRSGARPWKTVERSGHVTGSSTSKKAADASASAQNAAHRKKKGSK